MICWGALYNIMMKPWLVAHRGALHEAQENTIAAFKAAKEYPVAYIELDIRVTSDNIAVIHHNPDISGHQISESTYNDLKKLDPNLATLDETLQATNSTRLFVELKSKDSAPHAVDYLLSHPDSRATSFLLDELLYLQKAGVPNKQLFYAQYSPVRHLNRAVEHGFSGITFPKRNYFLIFWRKYAYKDLGMMIYTVNSSLFAKIIRSLTPKAFICTNRPDELQRLK